MFFTKFWHPRDIVIHLIKASWPARTCSMTSKWPFYSIFFHSIWNWASDLCNIFHFSLRISTFFLKNHLISCFPIWNEAFGIKTPKNLFSVQSIVQCFNQILIYRIGQFKKWHSLVYITGIGWYERTLIGLTLELMIISVYQNKIL